MNSYKPARQTVEMVTGKVYYSDDNWQTIFKIMPEGDTRPVVDRHEADQVRFLAAYQSSGGPA